MSVVDELMEQRDAVLFGQWVQRMPERKGEACLLYRASGPRGGRRKLSARAMGLVTSALFALKFPCAWAPAAWNDDDETRFGDVLLVLDEAIRQAKDSADRSRADAE